ncbi:SRPBCC domain-containing protein [Aquimarina sp. AU474]|uniref:SRPBCC domain-containing protein n=1 Tax=Aquimarina sp. AU474 TaxID=2108529 RepID=UPI000D687BD9|nr:SRPBCC domain-containing protein [Aquimarina sp. AU474]
MKKYTISIILICFPLLMIGQSRIQSVVDSTDTNNIVLKQTFEINVVIDSVWNAYTTARGWKKWAVPLAEIDFKINGLIRTNYNAKGSIGDDSTITLHIINYIPKKMLTLQAELTKNFPEFMKEDAKDLFNIITFEELAPNRTRVVSYGVGYKNNKKYKSLLQFFIKGNEQSYTNLITYLETGKPSLKY